MNIPISHIYNYLLVHKTQICYYFIAASTFLITFASLLKIPLNPKFITML